MYVAVFFCNADILDAEPDLFCLASGTQHSQSGHSSCKLRIPVTHNQLTNKALFIIL